MESVPDEADLAAYSAGAGLVVFIFKFAQRSMN